MLSHYISCNPLNDLQFSAVQALPGFPSVCSVNVPAHLPRRVVWCNFITFTGSVIDDFKVDFVAMLNRGEVFRGRVLHFNNVPLKPDRFYFGAASVQTLDDGPAFIKGYTTGTQFQTIVPFEIWVVCDEMHLEIYDYSTTGATCPMTGVMNCLSQQFRPKSYV
jgi:hypothetical protein